MKKARRYFISYTFRTTKGDYGVANMETMISTGINGVKDITAIEKSVLNDHDEYEKVVINNYIEFPD